MTLENYVPTEPLHADTLNLVVDWIAEKAASLSHDAFNTVAFAFAVTQGTGIRVGIRDLEELRIRVAAKYAAVVSPQQGADHYRFARLSFVLSVLVAVFSPPNVVEPDDAGEEAGK